MRPFGPLQTPIAALYNISVPFLRFQYKYDEKLRWARNPDKNLAEGEYYYM
jgi:hypothetical protein